MRQIYTAKIFFQNREKTNEKTLSRVTLNFDIERYRIMPAVQPGPFVSSRIGIVDRGGWDSSGCVLEILH